MNRTLMVAGVLATVVLALLIVACGSDPTPTPVPAATTPVAPANETSATEATNRRANCAADADTGITGANRGAHLRADSGSYGGGSGAGADSRGTGGSRSDRPVLCLAPGAGGQHRNR